MVNEGEHIELRMYACSPRKNRLDHFDRGKLAGAVQAREFRRAEATN